MAQLNEQFHRMQKLAGLITEGQANENFAANFVARGGMKTKYGSGASADSDSKEKTQGGGANASNEKVVAFFADAEKDSGFKTKADKLEADFQATWNSNKERYEKSGKWNETRQDSLKREWDSKKERLFQDKFAEENRDFEKADPAAFSKAYALIGKIATGGAKVEDLKTSAPPSLLGKIKGFFKEENIKEQFTKEEFESRLNEQYLRMQKLAGIITEGQSNEDQNSLESQITNWVNDNAGGYGPDENDDNLNKFNEEMKILLNNTLEDFNPDYYGDDTSMSPNDILEDFIEQAIDIIGTYTMDYYGDDTSFSPDDIKYDFYEFMGIDPEDDSEDDY